MEVIFLLVCVSLVLAVIFLLFFIWAAKNGQFEDCHTPAMKILFEDNEVEQNGTMSK